MSPRPRSGGEKQHHLPQIAGEAFIAFDRGMPTRVATDKLLSDAGVSVDVRMTNDNVYTLKKAVQAGVGLAIVPTGTVEEEVNQGSLSRLRIRDAHTERPLAVLKRRKAKLNKPTEVFVQHLFKE